MNWTYIGRAGVGRGAGWCGASIIYRSGYEPQRRDRVLRSSGPWSVVWEFWWGLTGSRASRSYFGLIALAALIIGHWNGTSCCGRCARESTPRMPQAAWRPACLLVSPNLNWNLVGNAAQPDGKRVGHRGQPIGRPKELDTSKAALAQRLHGSGESASMIAATLGVSRATVYRLLAERAADGSSWEQSRETLGLRI